MTGFARTYKRTYSNFKKNILDNYDSDVYICSWDKCQIKTGSNLTKVNESEILDQYKDNLSSYKFVNYEDFYDNRFKNIDFIDRDDDVFKVDGRAIEHGSFWVERLRDQWYIVNEAFKLIENPDKYDLIMRLRFDVDLINIELKNKNFVIPKDIGGWCYSDHFSYGSVNCMKKYCNTFDHIYNIYNLHNVDISHAVNMLKFYMEDYGDAVESFVDESIKYKIRK